MNEGYASGWSSTTLEHGWSSTDVEQCNVLNLLISDSEQPANAAEDLESVTAKPLPVKNLKHLIASEVSSGKSLKSRALSVLSVKSVTKDNCKCGKACIKKLSVKKILELRKCYWENSKSGRFQMILFHVIHSRKLGKFRLFSLSPELNLCSYAFVKCLGISFNQLTRAFEAHKRLEVSTPGRNPRNLQDNSLVLMTWLEKYAEMHGDRMPNTSQVLLPYGLVKHELYKKYVEECSTIPVSRSQFFSVWNKYFPHVKVKKTNSFTKCTTCTTIERQMSKTMCVETRALYRQQKESHNQRQMLERKYYYGKREQSRNFPEQYMSLIIDGMDQAKTNLPHFTGRRPKNMNGADLLKTHVTRVLNHGHGGFSTFVDVCQYSHDPNLTINVLLKTLLGTAEKNGNSLPATLYLQADNCYRENKNKSVLAFCELLVRCEIFTEVHLSFLYVGHTHEDVDCAFSKISETLRRREAETLDDLLQLLPDTRMLKDLVNVKGWLAPAIEEVSGVSRPLHYKFKRVNQTAITFYKGQHDMPWIQLESTMLRFIPDGKPEKLEPVFENIDCVAQMRQVNVLQHMFKKVSTLQKWKSFYEQIEAGTFENNTADLWILDVLPRQRIQSRFLSVIPEVIQLMAKETQEPQIRIKRRASDQQPANVANNSKKTK